MLSKYVVSAKSWNNDAIIYFNTKNSVSLRIDAKKFPDTNHLKQSKELLNILEIEGFLSDVSESNAIMNQRNGQLEKTLHLTIMTHQNCNFRCIYCYEKFEKGKMSLTTQKNIIDYVTQQFETGEFQQFFVSWFGGEPLLGMSVIQILSEKFIALCQQFDISYSANITTNGYYLHERFVEKLFEYGIYEYQVTIDGTRELHDNQRKLINGAGTYDRIISNLKKMAKRSESFRVLLRMNVGKDNLLAVDSFIDTMSKIFGKDNRFYLYFQNISYWSDNAENLILGKNITTTIMEKCIAHGANVLPSIFYLTPNMTCYASKPHSFVIGVDGNVYKCTVALYEEFNHVGNLLNNGVMEIDESKHKLWIETDYSKKNCLSCQIFPICQGNSCPLAKITNNNVPKCYYVKNEIETFLNLLDSQDLITYNVY